MRAAISRPAFSTCLLACCLLLVVVAVAFSLLFLISFLHLCYVALWVAPPFSVPRSQFCSLSFPSCNTVAYNT